MVTLYITRHGETEWNMEKRMQGWLDSDLTENGVKNAVSLGERLKEVEFEAIFSSPSGRTKTTSAFIRGDRAIPVVYDENLKEMNLGEWEGKNQTSIVETDSERFDIFWNAPHLYIPSTGESFEETRDRALLVLNRIKNDYASGNILIVTHAVVIKCLFSIFKNNSIENLWDPPFIHDTSLTIVNITEHGYEIVLEGDLSHRNVLEF